MEFDVDEKLVLEICFLERRPRFDDDGVRLQIHDSLVARDYSIREVLKKEM